MCLHIQQIYKKHVLKYHISWKKFSFNLNYYVFLTVSE